MTISPVTIGSAPAPARESAGGCGCGGCGCGSAEAASSADEMTVAVSTDVCDLPAGTTADYAVDGMTCGHGVKSVTEELSAVTGVSDVAVTLVAGGTSTVTVTSAAPLDVADVRAALDEAGYQLAGQA